MRKLLPAATALLLIVSEATVSATAATVAVAAGLRQAAAAENEEDTTRMARLFWFTVEFGLIREDGQIKVYGSGLISSHGDAANALGPKCDRRPFSLDAVFNQHFEIDHFQDVLFVTESFDQLYQAVEEAGRRIGTIR